MPDTIRYLRVHAVQEPGKDELAGLPDYPEDGDRYEHAHYRVGERVAEPHADGAEEDGEAGPAVLLAW